MRELFNQKNAKALMILAMAIFGMIGTMTYFINLPPSVIVVGRGMIGAGFLLLVIYISGSKLSKDDIDGNLFTLICSGTCLGLNWLFLFEAYKSVDISLATVLNYLTPALVILAAPVFLKTRLTVTKLGFALLALFGMVLISEILENGSLGSDGYGITCGVLAAVFYTGLVIFNKKLKSIGAYDMSFVQLLIGGLIVLIYTLFTIDYGSLQFDLVSVILVVILGVVQTAIAFLLYFGSLAYLDASTAVIYGYVEPVIGIFLSIVILHEDLGPVGWIGAALILGSTFMSEILERRKAKTIQKEQV